MFKVETVGCHHDQVLHDINKVMKHLVADPKSVVTYFVKSEDGDPLDYVAINY